MNEIFGEANFVAQLTVRSNPRGRQSDTHIARVHDFLVCYAKNEGLVELGGLPLTEEHSAEFDQKDEDGKAWRELGLRQRGSGSLRTDRPDMYFPIFVDPKTGKVALEKNGQCTIKVLPRKSDSRDGRWMWSPEKVQAEIGRVYGRLVSRRNEFDIFIRDYLERVDGERTTKPKSIWADNEVNNEVGKELLRRILGADSFPNPKPIGLLNRILTLATEKNDLVLDSFAGSGTTGHATLELNNNDAGQRQFVLIQMPYDTKHTKRMR
jgi:adenine-specific DNA-methyltransferase